MPCQLRGIIYYINSYAPSTMHYENLDTESATFQAEYSMPIAPVHIYPYSSSSATANQTQTNVVEPMVSTTFKSDDMPTLTPYPGPYNFKIFIPNAEFEESKRKGQTCVFQADEMGNNHLFTKPQPHYWRLNYSMFGSLPAVNNVFIRMVPVFGDPEKAQCVLERCPKHKEAVTDENGLKNRSMIVVEKTSAQYFQDKTSKRLCVLIPFEKHADGQTFSSVNCQFACYNSCFNQDSGGRKSLYLIVTVESHCQRTSKIEVLGRQSIQFRSCACPSRDWKEKIVKGDNESVSRGREKRIKVEKKVTALQGTPINMGGKDAIIRVLPSFPGIDEAVNALVAGFLYHRAASNGDSMDAVNDVFRQLKNVEQCIIEQFTSSYEPSGDTRSHSLSSSESQLSPVNTTANQHQHSSNMPSYSEYSMFPHPHPHPYFPTQIGQPPAANYPAQDLYTGFNHLYSDLKVERL